MTASSNVLEVPLGVRVRKGSCTPSLILRRSQRIRHYEDSQQWHGTATLHSTVNRTACTSWDLRLATTLR